MIIIIKQAFVKRNAGKRRREEIKTVWGRGNSLRYLNFK